MDKYFKIDTNRKITNFLSEDMHVGIIDDTCYKISGDTWKTLATMYNVKVKDNVILDKDIYTIDDFEQYSPKVKPTSINEAKEFKIKEINELCNEEILSGFVSSTKDGTEQHYDFNQDTQTNMLGIQNKIILAKLIGASDPEIKWYASGQTICENWTVEEFLALCKDAEKFKQDRIDKYKSLKSQIESATTEEDINNINW